MLIRPYLELIIEIIIEIIIKDIKDLLRSNSNSKVGIFINLGFN